MAIDLFDEQRPTHVRDLDDVDDDDSVLKQMTQFFIGSSCDQIFLR